MTIFRPRGTNVRIRSSFETAHEQEHGHVDRNKTRTCCYAVLYIETQGKKSRTKQASPPPKRQHVFDESRNHTKDPPGDQLTCRFWTLILFLASLVLSCLDKIWLYAGRVKHVGRLFRIQHPFGAQRRNTHASQSILCRSGT